jgi:predicted ATP-grasp superfamily ATP-dependent carboligase
MPCAIDEIRKLGRRGHAVIAADAFKGSPGNHSRYVEKALVTPSPRHETSRFIDAIASITRDEQVDLVMPAFEEVFYLARYEDALPARVRFFPSLDVLVRLHDKARFLELARSLDIAVPESIIVQSLSELMYARTQFVRFFAKPTYSRGGVDVLTNVGPLGRCSLQTVQPTPDNPWLVQEFVDGLDVCSFSVVQHGSITAHAAYVHPRQIDHAGGIVFESIDEPRCLELVRRIASETTYHGQISFDFKRTNRGMVLIECNPRPTAGVHLMTAKAFVDALLDEDARELRVSPPGLRCKYSFALLRDMLLHRGEVWDDLRHLLSDAKELIIDIDDPLPALYQVMSYGRVYAYRKQVKVAIRQNAELMAAYFYDVCWNGEPMADFRAVA